MQKIYALCFYKKEQDMFVYVFLFILDEYSYDLFEGNETYVDYFKLLLTKPDSEYFLVGAR